MPPFGPISRQKLIDGLRAYGCTGPHPGKRHQRMKCGNISFPIPNPHQGDIDVGLLSEILKQAGITREEWEQL